MQFLNFILSNQPRRWLQELATFIKNFGWKTSLANKNYNLMTVTCRTLFKKWAGTYLIWRQNSNKFYFYFKIKNSSKRYQSTHGKVFPFQSICSVYSMSTSKRQCPLQTHKISVNKGSFFLRYLPKKSCYYYFSSCVVSTYLSRPAYLLTNSIFCSDFRWI